MKIIILMFLFVITLSCEPGEPFDYVKNGYVHTIEVDGCEYILIYGLNGGGLTHKGNCKYCAERELYD